MIFLLIIGVILVFYIVTKILRNRDYDEAFLSLKNICILGIILILMIVSVSIGVNIYQSNLSKKAVANSNRKSINHQEKTNKHKRKSDESTKKNKTKEDNNTNETNNNSAIEDNTSKNNDVSIDEENSTKNNSTTKSTTSKNNKTKNKRNNIQRNNSQNKSKNNNSTKNNSTTKSNNSKNNEQKSNNSTKSNTKSKTNKNSSKKSTTKESNDNKENSAIIDEYDVVVETIIEDGNIVEEHIINKKDNTTNNTQEKTNTETKDNSKNDNQNVTDKVTNNDEEKDTSKNTTTTTKKEEKDTSKNTTTTTKKEDKDTSKNTTTTTKKEEKDTSKNTTTTTKKEEKDTSKNTTTTTKKENKDTSKNTTTTTEKENKDTTKNTSTPKKENTNNINNTTSERTGKIVSTTPAKEPTPTLSKDNNAMYFLNVGASTDAFIIYDNGKYGLIDTSYASKGNYIVKTLKKLGAKSLDFIIITHSHDDHVRGYKKIMNQMSVKTLYIKKDGAIYPSHQSTYKSIINRAKNKKTSVCDVKLKKCQVITLGNTKIKLYNTKFLSSKGISSRNKGRFDNANSIGAVATVNGKRIYFSGDIGNYFGYNQETKAAKAIGDIDVYKAAHHGYVTFNNHQSALNKLKAEYAIVTNTKGKASTAVKRLKKANKKFKKVYYTPYGTVKLKVNKNGKIIIKQ